MSQSNDPFGSGSAGTTPSPYGGAGSGPSPYGGAGAAGGTDEPHGKTETAKQEASELTETAKEQAADVVETAKQEVSHVAHEAKTQLKDVYAQTQQELKDQAAAQQRRVADGLRSVGEEFGAMARNADGGGMAADLVQQASTRLTGASSWLSQRDPGGLVQEVKTYARRRPGVFIAGAVLAGIAVGRLTRALAEGASDAGHASSSGSGTPVAASAGSTARPATGSGVAGTAGAAAGAMPPPVVGAPPAATPLYDQTARTSSAGEVGDGR